MCALSCHVTRRRAGKPSRPVHFQEREITAALIESTVNRLRAASSEGQAAIAGISNDGIRCGNGFEAEAFDRHRLRAGQPLAFGGARDGAGAPHSSPPARDERVRVVRGAVFAVALDGRRGSPPMASR